ncbi:MAG: DUF4870 domain-containing protein [Sedimentisphaerales bacterium]|nr:DUF4870 domain-containing protein [Sedimentisphaerales bacterium]
MANGNDVPGTGVPPVAGSPGPIEIDRETNRDARMWAMFCHLAGLAFLVVPAIGSVIGPLVIWLIKKDQHPFVDEQGKEALNFQITMLIYAAVATLLIVLVITACIGIPLVVVVGIADIVLIIVAAIKANDGYHYRYPYPFIIHFIK